MLRKSLCNCWYLSIKYPCSNPKKIGIGPGSRQPDWHLAEAAGIRPGSWHPAHYREMASGGKKCQLQQADKLLQFLVPRADRIPYFWPIGEGPTLRPPPGPKRYKTIVPGKECVQQGVHFTIGFWARIIWNNVPGRQIIKRDVPLYDRILAQNNIKQCARETNHKVG